MAEPEKEAALTLPSVRSCCQSQLLVCRQSVQQTRTRFKYRICLGLFPSIVYCSPSHPEGYHLLDSLPSLRDSFLSSDSPPQVFFDKSQRCNSWSPFKTCTCLCCHLCRFLSSLLIFSISPLLFLWVSTNSLHSLVLLSSLYLKSLSCGNFCTYGPSNYKVIRNNNRY